MTHANKDYQKLLDQSRHIGYLNGGLEVLHWDHETYMPEGGAEARGEQLKALTGIIHNEQVSSKLKNPLSKLIDLKTGKVIGKDLSPRESRALREWRRDYIINTALPKKFVEDFAKLSSDSIQAWKKARENNDFKAFTPYLKKVIEANRKKADYIGYKTHPYDALLDLYEPDFTTKKGIATFDQLKKGLLPLIQKISQSKKIDDSPLFGSYPKDKQLALSTELLKAVGFDFKHGRLDLATHPFSLTPHPTDSRLTTRIDEKNVFSCISTVMHEAGHSLYSMGLPAHEFGSPLGQDVSMGIHESQSRFWETRIGLSLPFIKYVLPLVKKTFPGTLQNITPQECYRLINKVEPSFIRVESDEVTYPLHVILRFELEKGLMEGALEAKDIPDAWNQKMKEYLRVTPKTNREGCLQDVHWAMGAIGYFPTYALGNLYAAQFFTAFEKQNPKWKENVAKGEFDFIRSFLHENVYKYGREFRSEELIEKATGRKFSPEDYLAYLHAKYGEIYQLDAPKLKMEVPRPALARK